MGENDKSHRVENKAPAANVAIMAAIPGRGFSNEIVQKHGGSIRGRNIPGGRGACVAVLLPTEADALKAA
jgi:hypothetical protein